MVQKGRIPYCVPVTLVLSLLLIGAVDRPAPGRSDLRLIELQIEHGRYVAEFEVEQLGPVELIIEDRGGLPSKEKAPKPKKDEPTPTRPRFQPPPNTPEHELLVGFRHAPLRTDERAQPALPPWLQGRSDIRIQPKQEDYRYTITTLPPQQAALFHPEAETILILLGPDHVLLVAYRFSAASGRFHPTELTDPEQAALQGPT
jgi:hypothetical protein